MSQECMCMNTHSTEQTVKDSSVMPRNGLKTLPTF